MPNDFSGMTVAIRHYPERVSAEQVDPNQFATNIKEMPQAYQLQTHFERSGRVWPQT